MELKKVLLADIIPPEIAMRSEIAQAKINDLASSIMEVGLINPLTLQKKGKKYEIIAGHQRFQAMTQLQFTETDANIIQVNENVMFQIRMDENLIRDEVSEFDEAIYLEAMQKKMDLTQNELAGKIGKSTSYVNERLAILNYHPQLLSALKTKQITFSVARELSRVKDRKAMLDFLRYAVVGGMNPATARKMVREWEQLQTELNDPDRTDSTDRTPADLIVRAMMTTCESCGVAHESDRMQPIWLCQECKAIFEKN